MWFGAKSMYDDAGFREVARRRPHRPVVRRSIAAAKRSASRRAALAGREEMIPAHEALQRLRDGNRRFVAEVRGRQPQ